MPNDRISVSYGLTINLGNYESERIDASYERDLGQYESIEEGFNTEFMRVKALVKTAAAARKR